MSEPSRSRRAYDSPARREQAARTRNRIIAAGSELVHEYTSWDWQELTFRAVAARAGVGERTVYRHFPTERELRDAVMRRLEDEAQISYADVDLANLTEVTGRFFAALQRFTVDPPAQVVDDPAFEGADRRRRDAVLRAVTESAPDWPAHRTAGRAVESAELRAPDQVVAAAAVDRGRLPHLVDGAGDRLGAGRRRRGRAHVGSTR